MTTATASLDALINRVGKFSTPFTIQLPDGGKRTLGEGKPEFAVTLHNDRALRAAAQFEAFTGAGLDKVRAVLERLVPRITGAV